MVITSLQEKENRKFYVPIREGNRGGWSLFEWQSVREMPYRDREMYLGNSAVIGVLDKGGKWRKRDWYLKTDKRHMNPNLSSEQEEAMRRDTQRMNEALGKGGYDDEQRLTEQQMQQILKKVKNKDSAFETSKQTVGLGFDKAKVQIRGRPNAAAGNAHRLQGIDQITEPKVKTEDFHERRRHKGKDSEERSRSEKRQRKQKKEKKEKKEKKHKRSRSKSHEKEEMKRERSRSRDKKSKKEKHKKDKHRD